MIMTPILFIFLLALAKVSASTLSVEKFLTLTHSEKLKLDEFRKKVEARLPDENMKEEHYLIRFLRENDFNLQASEKMLMDNIKWRKEKKIDTILTEDWSYFEEEYFPFVEGCDNEGQPVGSVSFGDWDIRREILISGQEKFLRYIDKIFEELFHLMIDMQKDGQNITHATLISDLKGFTLVNHACPACIAWYINMVISLQTHYPGFARRVVLVNAPTLVVTLWNTYKFVVSPNLRKLVTIFGPKKEDWQKYLLQEIPASQLSKRFGGTKEDALSFNDLRKSGKVFRCSREMWEYFV